MYKRFLAIAVPKQRVPLIKFLGKRSLLPAQSKLDVINNASPDPRKQIKQQPKASSGLEFWAVSGGAWYGRPKISAVEMDAIESGGASIPL